MVRRVSGASRHAMVVDAVAQTRCGRRSGAMGAGTCRIRPKAATETEQVGHQVGRGAQKPECTHATSGFSAPTTRLLAAWQSFGSRLS
ncbi:hypothetical protein XAP6164_5410005 [Xanthomonas phaseoli pv. phaseoli]|nr:hypothetical protein XAP6164_5410005 [Xanthomonas phaseoli pv. phaseoli]